MAIFPTTARSVSVLIADDHPIVRSGLRALLQDHDTFHVVAEVESGHELFPALTTHLPDILMLDLSMPGLDDAGAFVQEAKAQWPALKVLVLTSHDNPALIASLIQGGCDGYMLKEDAEDALLGGLEQLAAGHSYYTPSVMETVVQLYTTPQRAPSPLTAREMDVVQLVAVGRGNKAIAQALHISPSTVGNHISNILGKLQLQNRTELTRYAMEHGWTSPDA